MRNILVTVMMVTATLLAGVSAAPTAAATTLEAECHGQSSFHCTYEECHGEGDNRTCHEHRCLVWWRDLFRYACVVGSVG